MSATLFHALCRSAPGIGFAMGEDRLIMALQAALEKAMQAPEERERRGQAAHVLAQRFAWSRVACEVVELYGRIAALKSCARI